MDTHLDAAEFDRFADEYLAAHARNIAISGESPDYFARYKIDELRRRWTSRGREEPRRILDFGAGIGNSLPFLAERFAGARVTGLDVSDKSLKLAARRFPGVAELVCYDGGDIPLPAGEFDLIFSACVFHHIQPSAHVALLRQLRTLLRPTGLICIFEHNPLNPVTRHIVATCPFDENAILIAASRFQRAFRAAGYQSVGVAYTGFFPGGLSALRPLERFMTRIPLGAQYYVLARP